MKSLGRFFCKYLAAFSAVIIMLFLSNLFAYGLTFRNIVNNDYGETSPKKILELFTDTDINNGISEKLIETLKQEQIWAIFINKNGFVEWSANMPDNIPNSYTLQDVAVFSKGYIEDYPVFTQTFESGLLVIGYPRNSYVKITSNYYSQKALVIIPYFIAGVFVFDILFLFAAFYFSKRKIDRNTVPIISAVENISNGKAVNIDIRGDLSDVAESLNKASEIISKQNIARANWISGVSHDIRTPLSIIMGYAERIINNQNTNDEIKANSCIIKEQSIVIKDLVQDLNIVSKLQYEMQPINKEPVRLSTLIRTYTANLLNMGLSDKYEIEIDIHSNADNIMFECDSRLITRAINNLVQNSINHNSDGCAIKIALIKSDENVIISVSDNGKGFSEDKIREFNESSHYMECTDERLNLRHGLGLYLVKQIALSHNGTIQLENNSYIGCVISLSFPL